MGDMIDLDWQILRSSDQIESAIKDEVFDGGIGAEKLKGPIREVLGSTKEISSPNLLYLDASGFR